MVSEVLAMGHKKRMVADVLTYSLLKPSQVCPDSCDARLGSGNNVGSVVLHVILLTSVNQPKGGGESCHTDIKNIMT